MKTPPEPTRPEIDTMSMLAHQLSTPLAAIHWYAEMLHKGKMAKPLDETQSQFLDEILDGAARMGELVEDIHNVSRLDRNKFSDEVASTSLAKIIAEDHDQLQTAASDKKLKLRIQADTHLPEITTWPSVLHMIVQNLLSNAIKYTPDQGSIEVALRSATAEEAAKLGHHPDAALLISVSDTGYGIPKAAQTHIFEKFFRADNVRSLGIPGSGLGTYIIAAATEKLGGAAWFNSTEQQGTTFFVVLPLLHDAGRAAKNAAVVK